MNKEKKVCNIDWKNQIFEIEDGTILPFSMDEEINVLSENIKSFDGTVYVYKPNECNEKEQKTT